MTAEHDHDHEGHEEHAVSESEERLFKAMKTAYDMAVGVEPALGKVTRNQVDMLGGYLDDIPAVADRALDELPDDDREGAERSLAIVYARCAAVAIAAGDEGRAHHWLIEAAKYADEDQLVELAVARKDPERYRQLVHGRNLMFTGQEREARKLWEAIVKGPVKDALATAAKEELAAPRPLNGHMPSLWSYNGFGVGFAGHRDEWPDGSYATTQCLTALWIPLFPLKAYRVARDGEGWIVMAREQLSGFARAMRYALLAAIVLVIGGVWINSYVNDPNRLARKRFDETYEVAGKAKPEAALRDLLAVVDGPEAWRVSGDRLQRAGAKIIQLTAGLVPSPFGATDVDHANRLVARFKALPARAQGGVARDAVVDALERWIDQLGTKPETADARLALLVHAADVADVKRAGPLATKVTATRLAVADAKAEDWPLDALAILVAQPHTEAMTRANKIVARLVESPSMLVEAGADLDKWIAATSTTDPVRVAAVEKRDVAAAARAEVEAEEVAPAQLAAMAKARPWDQYVALRLARAEASEGKLEAAAARVGKLGKPGMMLRDARLLLGQLSAALGKLEEADALLSGLLAGRLPRFIAASAAYEAASKKVEDRIKLDLQTGTIPPDLESKLTLASEERQRELVREWMLRQMENDPGIVKAREDFIQVADIVPVSIAAGSVKLRRAQGMAGEARDAMLREAERTFLAVRSAAEGQPEFRMNLGEIYARLGKTKESEEEFSAVLDKNDPALSLQVATIYRNIGSVERSKQVARGVFELKDTKTKDDAAMLLAMLARDEKEEEEWYRKADPSHPEVKISLLAIEGSKLMRDGKLTECAAKFAEVARMHLAGGNASVAGLNNAAVAHTRRYRCNGDPAALRDAQAQYEKAYKLNSEQPIVVGNLAISINMASQTRVLGKRVDVRALRLLNESAGIVSTLLDGQERDALLADLAADPGMRRSEDLYAQFEVLAPNNAAAYRQQLATASMRRDEAAAAAVVERARRAKGLDTSEAAAAREKWLSGAADADYFEESAGTVAELDNVLARPKLDGKTRATALYLLGNTLAYAVYKNDVEGLARARKVSLDAMKLWPALNTTGTVIDSLIDEAGLAADGEAWIKLRRELSATAALTKLVADGSPLAGKIKASAQWSEVAGHARADTTRPTVFDLRVARLLGDPALEARAKAALDDKVLRASYELQLVLDPGDPAAKADLAYLDKR